MKWLRAILAVFRRAQPKPQQRSGSTPVSAENIVDQYPLSYGQQSDPISDAARVEIERQKNWRGSGSGWGVGG